MLQVKDICKGYVLDEVKVSDTCDGKMINGNGKLKQAYLVVRFFSTLNVNWDHVSLGDFHFQTCHTPMHLIFLHRFCNTGCVMYKFGALIMFLLGNLNGSASKYCCENIFLLSSLWVFGDIVYKMINMR